MPTRRQARAEERRERIRRSVDQLRIDPERRFLGAMRRFWREESAAILDALDLPDSTQGLDADEVVDSIYDPNRFRRRFNRHALPVWNFSIFSGVAFEAEFASDLVDDEAEEQRSMALDARRQAVEDVTPSLGVEVSDSMRASIGEFLEQRKVGVWNRVGSATHRRLGKAVRAGIVAGDTGEQLTDRVAGVLKNRSRNSARVIARTEVTGSMNFGQQAERVELKIPKKEWIGRLDERNRGADPQTPFDHISPNGQKVQNADAFTVSGESLMFPGDSANGSPGNVIQCRCIAIASL